MDTIGSTAAISAFSGFACGGRLPDSRDMVSTADKRAAYLARLLKELCTDLGPRPIGSEACGRGAEIIRRELAMACSTAFLDEFTFERWVLHGEPEFTVDGRPLETYPGHGSLGTPPEGLSGVLRKIEDEGRIPFGLFDPKTGEMTAYVTNRYGKAVPLPYYMFRKKVKCLPMFNIGGVDMPVIEDAAARELTVRCRSEVEFIPNTPTANAVGIIPGKSPEEILFIAHHDTVYNTAGANDNTASVIVMIMLAHAFSGRKPAKTLTFLATTGEEYDKLGAINYAERRKREGTFGNIRHIINFDSLTWGLNLKVYMPEPDLRELVQTVDRELNLPGDHELIDGEGFQLDSRPFRETAAQAMYVNSTGHGNDVVWHRPEDTPDSVPPECAELGFRMFGEVTGRLMRKG